VTSKCRYQRLRCPTLAHSPAQHSVSVVESVCGALPSTLERSLDTFFGARLVQGYAMTECMPVACPPPHAGVNKPGLVRKPSRGSHRLTPIVSPVRVHTKAVSKAPFLGQVQKHHVVVLSRGNNGAERRE
jgi:acyl-CoA synthetase (AMP-forming)/AMP-acid ligase II